MTVDETVRTPFMETLEGFSLKQLQSELANVEHRMTQLSRVAQLLELAITLRETAEQKYADGRTADVALRAPAASATATAPTPRRVGGRPPLRVAVLAVMTDGEPGYRWSPAEIHRALDARNWAPTGQAARAQISNRLADLVKAEQVERVAPGRYVLTTRTDEPDPTGLFIPAGSEEG
jgi:hypothetical protein